ncbi:MAG: ABC transporter ATP-binding protein [Deltaproteobacteria bacterium]|nr:ABC transporter ATP-binding protein [Deltaproteobacteria bacterium]
MGLNGSSILELQNIVKRFGTMTAVNHVSLDLEKGKLITFLGPSGCGKTTLLRVVSGFTVPDEGRVLLDGEDITEVQPNARDTAMVFQNYALFPHMTVADNIAFGLRIMKKPKREVADEVERLLSLVQMEGLGGRRPHELSGGQQQRVALARALSLHPKILLLDEPLSNLDANLRLLMRGEIRKLHRRLGLSIIFVTHDQEEAMSLSDQLVVMDQGVVKQIGSPTEIYETPVDEFVARFIGHINFLPGEVTAVREGRITFRTCHGDWSVAQPSFPVAPGERMEAVVRPESIGIRAADEPHGEEETNVIEGRVEFAMYIGAIIRYTVLCGEQTMYIDETDPQYTGILKEGTRVRLSFKDRIHMLRLGAAVPGPERGGDHS